MRARGQAARGRVANAPCADCARLDPCARSLRDVHFAMTSGASSLAQSLAQHPDEDVLQAISLLMSLRPNLSEGLAAITQEEPAPRYTGSITNFQWERNFGFIRSEEAKTDFGKDVFLSDKEIGHHNVGDQVSFTVVINKDGRPQARLLMPATSTAGDWQGVVAAPPPRPPSPAAMVVPPPAAGQARQWSDPWSGTSRTEYNTAVQAVNRDGRYTGRIAVFHQDRHYGFIESEAVHKLFSKDVFLSDQELGKFQVGETVTFAIAVNRAGQPQARSLEHVAGGNGPFPVKSAKRPLPMDGGVNTPPPPPPKVVRGVDDAGACGGGDKDPSGGRYVGVISQFSSEKRYGFIKCENAFAKFGKDTFLSDQEIGTFNVGSVVSFRVELNKQSKPQARELLASIDEPY